MWLDSNYVGMLLVHTSILPTKQNIFPTPAPLSLLGSSRCSYIGPKLGYCPQRGKESEWNLLPHPKKCCIYSRVYNFGLTMTSEKESSISTLLFCVYKNEILEWRSSNTRLLFHLHSKCHKSTPPLHLLAVRHLWMVPYMHWFGLSAQPANASTVFCNCKPLNFIIWSFGGLDCCIFWPANGCFTLHLLVEICFFAFFVFFSFFTSFWD